MTRAHPTDGLGNPVTGIDPGSLERLNDFVEGFIASEARAVRILEAADDPCPLVQACCAALHLFAESAAAPVHARPFIDRALARAHEASEREQRWIAAIAAWADGDTARAADLHEEQARLWPRDLASLKLGLYHRFNRGDSPGMLRMALAARDAAADVPYLHGMLAFAWEQCHCLAEAEAAARTAIGLRRKEPWAHHALAHVMLTQGRIHEGLAFLESVNDTWTGLNSFMLTHNWWHQALFLLELDRHADALALYDTRVWGVEPGYSQDQINAISLLARLELAGVDVGERWADVARHVEARGADLVLPFLDLQYLYGLARAGRWTAAAALRDRMAEHAAQLPAARGAAAWLRVAVPAAQGLFAHAQGDWGGAIDHLGQALPRMVEVGGSHAQRDLFQQIYLDALQCHGEWTAAQNLLQPQCNALPESRRLARQANVVYAALGLPALASARDSDAASRTWS